MTYRPRQAASGHIPPEIRAAADYERLAPGYLADPVHAYVCGGCGEDRTVAANRAAFGRFSIVPRVLCDPAGAGTGVRLAGEPFDHPLLVAPVALQRLVHPGAEIESARGAAAADAGIVVSTLASSTLEDIAAVAGPRRWFQLTIQPSPAATLALLERAEAAGYRAIVVTLDATIQMASAGALRAGFRMPDDCRPANLADDVERDIEGERAGKGNGNGNGNGRIFAEAARVAPTWDLLDGVLARSRVPVWAKGVLHPDDARRLQARGVAGIVVSNHGGRTVDGVPSSLAMLPAIRRAVGPDYPLILDGGIRSGADAFVAIALGADAVLAGRLPLFALGIAGALGVAHVLRLLREELEACMVVTGCRSVADISPDRLVPGELAGRPFGATTQERPHQC
ncbi:MAG: alpha-hydroxy acid oxidase [Lautropia sp.]